jgi:indolepyruvate ferredoxin oxidoreductase, beta subunit
VSTFNVLVAGVGGQGVLLTSKILAEASLLSGFDIKQSEVHGMAQRGGSVVSQVRFGEKVYSPIVSEGECDLLIGFEPLETARYLHFLRDGGQVVYNTHRITTLTVSVGADVYPDNIQDIIAANAAGVHPFDATGLAVQAGNKRTLNLVLLGAAMRYLPLKDEHIMESIKKCVPSKALETNIRAFQAGREFFASSCSI